MLRTTFSGWICALAAPASLALCGCPPPDPVVPPPTSLLDADPPPTADGQVPGAATGDLDRGMEYLKQNAFAEAIPYLEKAVAAQPKNGQAVYYLARCYDAAGKRDKAIAGYEQALQLDPTLLEARVNLGSMYMEEDPPRAEKAIEVLTPALKVEPDAADLRRLLAFAYDTAKQYDKSAEHYRAALASSALKPNEVVELRFALGEVLAKAGKKDEMAAELGKLTTQYEKEKDVKHMAIVGMKLAKAGAFDACVETFARAIHIDQKDPNLWLNRGICRHELKQDEEKVADDYRKAIDLDKSFQPGWYYLGMSFSAQKKRAQAVDAFEKCRKLGPDTPVGKKAAERKEALVKEMSPPGRR
jgi:tetratricopeptide (TPR) repeat protein